MSSTTGSSSGDSGLSWEQTMVDWKVLPTLKFEYAPIPDPEPEPTFSPSGTEGSTEAPLSPAASRKRRQPESETGQEEHKEAAEEESHGMEGQNVNVKEEEVSSENGMIDTELSLAPPKAAVNGEASSGGGSGAEARETHGEPAGSPISPAGDGARDFLSGF